MDYEFIDCIEIEPSIRRIFLNRPNKRNALCNPLRKELFNCLEALDNDSKVKVIIISGKGSCFCAGYDLSYDNSKDLPYHASKTDGFWPRHVVEGAFKIWDLSTPVIAEVHGYCLAGGTELAASCDLVYCSDDPIQAKKLEDVGASAIMPLASPIGSGLGIQNKINISIIIKNSKVPVIIDAGIGTASDATIAMELGCDGVLINSAIAKAKNPILMARSFKNAVISGREAFLAGRMKKNFLGNPSSPLAGLI